MASKKRKSYSGTRAEHTKDAAGYAKFVRAQAKRVVVMAKNGDCYEALGQFEAVANAEGRYAISRLYTKSRSTVTRSTSAIGKARRAVAQYCLR
jgi:hypothetical protein